MSHSSGALAYMPTHRQYAQKLRARWVLIVDPSASLTSRGPFAARTQGLSMAFSDNLIEAAEDVLALAKQKDQTIVTAESCTSGLLASVLSEAPGAAELLHGGLVTYTKQNKTVALSVSAELLRTKGAVCPQVACAMAEGALMRSPATLAISITGVAGPSPDEDGNPVGKVCIAVARRGYPTTHIEQDYGDIGRDAVRERAMLDALAALKRALLVIVC